jgi:hypothetical protein
MRRAAVALVFTAAFLRTRGAFADDAAAAQALFDDAKRLTAAGNLAEACPKFLASLKLDPKPGAAVNLADCYEKSGKLASAWARYLEAATLAERMKQAEREQYAKEHAAALEPQLSRLTIVVTNPPPGMQLQRDGEALDAAGWGSAVPVDAGSHVVEARAPGKKPWSTNVDVPAGAAQLKMTVPPLEDGPAEGASGLGAQRVAGIAIGGVGLAGVVVGAVFGGLALSNWSGLLQNHCHGSPTMCDATGIAQGADARRNSTISTIGFIAGGVVLATGVVVFVTAPRRVATAPTTGWAPGVGAVDAASLFVTPDLGPGRAGLRAGGAF